MNNILVSIDFDDITPLLLDKARSFAEKFDAKIWLLHAAAPDPAFVGYDVGPQYIRDSRAEELKQEHKKLQEYRDQLLSEGLDADGLLIQGATIDTIAEESRKLKIDMIICGYHRQGFLYDLIFGSTSEEILRKTEIPVLVVPLVND